LLAASAVGLALNIDWLTIADALVEFTPPPGRLRLVAGLNQSWLIDDTYNSSPAAVEAAIGALAEFPTFGRKVAVLGDMLELGERAVEAHRAAGEQAAKEADFIFTIGVRSRFTAEAAFNKKRRLKNRVQHFESIEELAIFLPEFIKPGDVLLFKASQSVRLERVVRAVMAEPKRAAALLCRQEPEWLNKK
jgi:UDP-N-acetylmuramoyl-tripeptide--D-alanyl-D-alanine ligase